MVCFSSFQIMQKGNLSKISRSFVFIATGVFLSYAALSTALANTNEVPKQNYNTEAALQKILAQQKSETAEEKQNFTQNHEEMNPYSVSPSELKKAIDTQSKQGKIATSEQKKQSITALIANYPLNEPLLTKLETIHSEIIKLPEPKVSAANLENADNSLDAFKKALEKRPDIMSILGRNLITADNYILAMQAVSNAFAHAAGVGDVETKNDNQISERNLEFGKKYENRIRKMLQQ